MHKLGRGNVVMVEAFNVGYDFDMTYLYVGEIVEVRNIRTNPLAWRTLYKVNPHHTRSKYLITMRVCDGRYIRFYDCDIDVFVVVREKAI